MYVVRSRMTIVRTDLAEKVLIVYKIICQNAFYKPIQAKYEAGLVPTGRINYEFAPKGFGDIFHSPKPREL